MAHTIIIGDIHGCYEELMELLARVKFGPDDRVVAVGDLITKGEKNREVLDLFIDDERFSSVIGNHDLVLRRYWQGEPVKLKSSQKMLCDLFQADEPRYGSYLSSLPYMIDLGTHLVVHAGVRPGVSLEEQAVEDLTQLRTLGADRTSRQGLPWYEVYNGEKIVLFGHWPAPEPRLARRAIGLDTGCVYGYRLTAYVIETDEFVSVPARRAYVQAQLS